MWMRQAHAVRKASQVPVTSGEPSKILELVARSSVKLANEENLAEVMVKNGSDRRSEKPGGGKILKKTNGIMLTFSKVDINKMAHVNVCYFILLRMLCCKCFFRVAKTLVCNIFFWAFWSFRSHAIIFSTTIVFSCSVLPYRSWMIRLTDSSTPWKRRKGWCDTDKQLKWSWVIMRSVNWSTLAPAPNMKLNEDYYACRSRLKQRWMSDIYGMAFVILTWL